LSNIVQNSFFKLRLESLLTFVPEVQAG
jgi:hypothetical protein